MGTTKSSCVVEERVGVSTRNCCALIGATVGIDVDVDVDVDVEMGN